MQGRFVALVTVGVAALTVSAAAAAPSPPKGPPPPPRAVNGKAVTVVARGVPTPTTFAFVLAWSNGTLYVSGGTRVGKLFAWSGWNGTRFTKSRVVAAPGKGFT